MSCFQEEWRPVLECPADAVNSSVLVRVSNADDVFDVLAINEHAVSYQSTLEYKFTFSNEVREYSNNEWYQQRMCGLNDDGCFSIRLPPLLQPYSLQIKMKVIRTRVEHKTHTYFSATHNIRVACMLVEPSTSIRVGDSVQYPAQDPAHYPFMEYGQVVALEADEQVKLRIPPSYMNHNSYVVQPTSSVSHVVQPAYCVMDITDTSQALRDLVLRTDDARKIGVFEAIRESMPRELELGVNCAFAKFVTVHVFEMMFARKFSNRVGCCWDGKLRVWCARKRMRTCRITFCRWSSASNAVSAGLTRDALAICGRAKILTESVCRACTRL